MPQGLRGFRPTVAALESRQLMSNTPFTTIASFHGTNQSVVSALVEDAQGNLYGTASGGGQSSGKADSTVFEIPAGTKSPTTLASFDNRAGYVIGPLTIDPRGNLYGTISGEGGTIGNGQAFEIAAGSKAVTMLASFNNYNTEFPEGIAVDSLGNVFGTAALGGASGAASVFEIAPGSGVAVPQAGFFQAAPAPHGVTIDAQGNLYGTNAAGGPKGAGSVYELPQGSNTIVDLANFIGYDGAGISKVALDTQGNLYGTTLDGGLFGDGTVFEIARGSNTITTLASFDGTNGTAPDPLSGVVIDALGNLYGTTEGGGKNGYGTIFEVARGTNQATTLATFSGAGQSLIDGLTLDAQGNLDASTNGSGGGGGSVLRFALPQAIAASTLPPALAESFLTPAGHHPKAARLASR